MTNYKLPNVPHSSEFKKKKYIRRDGHIYRIWDRLDEKRWQKKGTIGIFKKTKRYIKEKEELDKKKMEDVSLNTSKKQINNETLGISAEVAFCKIYDLNYPSHLDCRCDEDTCNSLIPICNNIKKTCNLEIIEHIGSKNGPSDFKLSNNKTLSLKTLKSDRGKICPQKIGQPTRKSWDNQFNLKLKNIEDTNDESFITIKKKKFYIKNEIQRKKWIKDNIDIVITEMFKYLLCCSDNIIIIIKTNDDFQYVYFPKKDIIKFDKEKFSYTNGCLDGAIHESGKHKGEYYEGTTVKYDNIRLGEFQFHNNRDNIKFRFYYKGLIELLKNNIQKSEE